MKTKPTLVRFRLVWSPEGKTIAEVLAPDAKRAIRKAPLPYRRYLGEIYAEPIIELQGEPNE